MSTVCRYCQSRVQRLQEAWNNTPASSGSRTLDPWALGPKRGHPQYIHNRRTEGLTLLECRRPWARRVQVLRAKTAAFLKGLSLQGQSRHAMLFPHSLWGGRRAWSPALSRPLFLLSTVATGLKPGREHALRFSSRVSS